MFFKQQKLKKISDKIFLTASVCSSDLAVFLVPKVEKILLFEIIVYLMSRVDLAMVRNKVQENFRSALLEAVWSKVDSNFSNLVKDISISEAINERMNQYGEIYRTSSGTEFWKNLHEVFRQLLWHASQNKYLFKWRMGRNPLILGKITEDLTLQALLTELETKRIIQFEADCNKIFKKID